MMKSPLFLGHMSRGQVAEAAPGTTLILPTAAVEQHGPHLPLATDLLITEAIASAVANSASRDVPVCLAPSLAFGNSHHHLAYTALSLSSATFQAVLMDVLDCIVRAGFQRIFILNGHGGNDENIRLAARDVILRSDVTIAANSYWTIAGPAIDDLWHRHPFPGHAGVFETSLMMALAPELVNTAQMPLATDHPTSIGLEWLFAGSVVRHGDWELIDGYTDAPTEATAEAGKRVFDVITGEVRRAVVSFHRAARRGSQGADSYRA